MEASGSLIIRTDSGQQITVDGSEFDFEVTNTEQRQMGTESCHHAEYSDEENDVNITIEVYEYPVDAYDSHEVTVSGGSIESDGLEFHF